jgi:hypothetical protein
MYSDPKIFLPVVKYGHFFYSIYKIASFSCSQLCCPRAKNEKYKKKNQNLASTVVSTHCRCHRCPRPHLPLLQQARLGHQHYHCRGRGDEADALSTAPRPSRGQRGMDLTLPWPLATDSSLWFLERRDRDKKNRAVIQIEALPQHDLDRSLLSPRWLRVHGRHQWI